MKALCLIVWACTANAGTELCKGASAPVECAQIDYEMVRLAGRKVVVLHPADNWRDAGSTRAEEET